MAVSADAMIFIWGLQKPHFRAKKPSRQDLADLQKRAKLLIRELNEAGEKIIIPTVAVTELLCGVLASDHGDFIAELQRRFIVIPFDLRASALAAELFIAHDEWPESERYETRPRLKADTKIIATAKIAGAATFYSHDKRARKLAELAGMTAKNLPIKSQDMFLNVETLGET